MITRYYSRPQSKIIRLCVLWIIAAFSARSDFDGEWAQVRWRGQGGTIWHYVCLFILSMEYALILMLWYQESEEYMYKINLDDICRYAVFYWNAGGCVTIEESPRGRWYLVVCFGEEIIILSSWTAHECWSIRLVISWNTAAVLHFPTSGSYRTQKKTLKNSTLSTCNLWCNKKYFSGVQYRATKRPSH